MQRPPWHLEADAILRASATGRISCAAVSLSLATVFYIARRLVGDTQARGVIRTCLGAFEILPVTAQTLSDADALPGADFEDNIQIAAAVESGIDVIVTRDPSGFTASPVTVLSPSDGASDDSGRRGRNRPCNTLNQ